MHIGLCGTQSKRGLVCSLKEHMRPGDRCCREGSTLCISHCPKSFQLPVQKLFLFLQSIHEIIFGLNGLLPLLIRQVGQAPAVPLCCTLHSAGRLPRHSKPMQSLSTSHLTCLAPKQPSKWFWGRRSNFHSCPCPYISHCPRIHLVSQMDCGCLNCAQASLLPVKIASRFRGSLQHGPSQLTEPSPVIAIKELQHINLCAQFGLARVQKLKMSHKIVSCAFGTPGQSNNAPLQIQVMEFMKQSKKEAAANHRRVALHIS
mmetsp:Transcript_8755/g.14377  ORF Transcript_8755/g.14377 Transcript_8755/m.14377 type:complete len:259 (+) Transcript_8755:129-905(+)